MEYRKKSRKTSRKSKKFVNFKLTSTTPFKARKNLKIKTPKTRIPHSPQK